MGLFLIQTVCGNSGLGLILYAQTDVHCTDVSPHILYTRSYRPAWEMHCNKGLDMVSNRVRVRISVKVRVSVMVRVSVRTSWVLNFAVFHC